MTKKLLQLLRDNASARAEGEQIIRSEDTADALHLYVYDVIDAWWGASAEALVAALAAAPGKPVSLHINSPGGDVFEARAMSAALVAHSAPVTTYIDGVCASAATYLALCADQVHMTEGGLFMVHNSWTFAYGNKTELAKTVELLGKIDAGIAADYARRTGKTMDEIVAWMEAETWFDPTEAKDAGFVDTIVANTRRSGGEAAAEASAGRWNLSAYARAPKLARTEPPKRDAGLDAAVTQQLQANRNRLRLFTA